MVALSLEGWLVPIFSLCCSGATETWKQLPAALPLPKPLCSGYAPVNDIQLYYAIYGRGKALILLHGGWGTWRILEIRSRRSQTILTPTGYKEFVAAVRKMWRTQPQYSPRQLASIRCPTLVIDGAYDEAIKRSHSEQMNHFIPNSKLVILPDVSHFAMFQKPTEFNEVVLEFLKSNL